MKRIDIWDGWRGLAISFLLMGHFIDIEWIWEDRLGVDLFFVLSGMLMSKILFEQRTNLKDFYIRRFSRIFPVLLLFVLTVYSLATVAGWEYQIREIFANLTFIRTYYPSEPHIWDVTVPTGHLWSLNVEEHAYLIMSIMTIIFLRNKYAASGLILLGLLSIMICFYNYLSVENYNHLDAENLQDRFRIRTDCAISFIFLSAGYNLFKNSMAIKPNAAIPVLTFLIAITCYVENFPDWLSFSLAPILLAFTVNHLVDTPKFFQSLLSLKVIRMVGIWSYSIYLWQQVFYRFSYAIPGGAMTGLFLSIMVGILSFYLYENPIRSWINSRWTKRNTAST